MAFLDDKAMSFPLPFETGSSLFDFHPDQQSWSWTSASESVDVFGQYPTWSDSPASSDSPTDNSSPSSSSFTSADSPASSNQYSPFLDATLALPSPSGALGAFAPRPAGFSSTICPTALHSLSDTNITVPSPLLSRPSVFSFPANPHPTSQRVRAGASHAPHAPAPHPADPTASTSLLPPYPNTVGSSSRPAALPPKPKRVRAKPAPKAGVAALAQRRPLPPVHAAPTLADLFKAVRDAELRSRKRTESPRESWYEDRLRQWQARAAGTETST